MIIPKRKIIVATIIISIFGLALSTSFRSSGEVNHGPFNIGKVSIFDDFDVVTFRINNNLYVTVHLVMIVLLITIIPVLLTVFYASYGNSKEFQYFVNTALFLAGFDLQMRKTGRKIQNDRIKLNFNQFGRAKFTVFFPHSDEAINFGLINNHPTGTGEISGNLSQLQITLLQINRYLQSVHD